MRATGTLMGCPGRSACVFGDQCPVDFYDDPPAHWTACFLEASRYDQLREGLVPWIIEARRRPKIVDPNWIEELSDAYIEAQIRYERLWRYARGSGLTVGWPEYRDDPIIQRFEKRVTEQRDELRYYLHELINILRVAQGTDRVCPLPGHRTRNQWFGNTNPRPSTESPPAPRTARRKTRAGTKKDKQKRKRHRKLYKAHRVKTIIKRRRRRNAP